MVEGYVSDEQSKQLCAPSSPASFGFFYHDEMIACVLNDQMIASLHVFHTTNVFAGQGK
jgi:hypothetical protein